MNSQLPARVPLNRRKPKEQESLYSFLYGLAIENGFDHMGSMFTELESAAYDENCNEVHPDLVWVDYITDLLNKMKIDIQPLIVNQYDNLLVRKDKEISKRRFSYRKNYHRYSTKFCPDCLNEDFFHHIYWDVSIVTTCVKHNIELITNCSKCGEFIRLSRLMRNSCRCGEKFTNMKAKAPDTTTVEVQMIFQEFLLGNRKKIMRCDRSFLSREEYFDFFYSFSLLINGIDLEKFHFSSQFQFKGEISMIDPDIRKIDTDKFNLMVNTIHFLIINPSEDFIELIEAVSETGSGLSYMSKEKSLKYKILNRLFSLPKGAYYHEVYSDYLYSKKDEYINRRFALPPLVKEKKYIPIHEATKLLKSEFTTVMNLCHHELLKLHVTEKNGKKISLIERESVEEYLEMRNNCFSSNQTMEYLGLTFRHVNALIEQKLIKPSHGPSVDGYERWYIPKKEVLRFEELLNSKFLPLSLVKGKAGITIKDACFKLRLAQINVEGVYQLIIDDRLRVFHDKDARLRDRIKILDEDVNELVIELYYKKIAEKGYFGKQIQRACKSDQKVITRFLEDGVLKVGYTEIYGKRTPVKYIPKQQIIEYLKKYKEMTDEDIEKHLKKVEVFFEPRC